MINKIAKGGGAHESYKNVVHFSTYSDSGWSWVILLSGGVSCT